MQISPSFILIDVLCVPSFNFNLISVSKHTKNLHCYLIFLGNCCFIQNLTQWSMIGLGRECNGLYLLQNSSVHITFTVKASSSSALWYTRLGHPSYSKFSLLRIVLDVNVSNKLDCCDVCHFSKQKRLPFVCSNHVSNKPFELIHCDLWGPFTTCTFDGFKYFLTIVDDFTRCTWVYLVKQKSDTQFLLPQFANMVKTQFNATIKTIRSDNGIKFYLKHFFHTNGILHQLSCIDTP